MQLDAGDRKELAAFLAKRFPGVDERAQLAARAQLDAHPGDAIEAWTHLLEEAQREHAMARLGQVLAAAAPSDRNLQEAVRLLTPARSMGRLGPIVAAAIVVVGVGGWALWPAPEVSARSEALAVATPSPAPPAAPTSATAPAAPSPAAPTPAETPEPPATAPPPAAAAAPAAEPAPAPTAPTPALAAVGAPTRVIGCDGLGSGVVGWWYAGTARPGAVGDVVALPRDARVRAEYPSAANGHDARTPERCVLPNGTRVRLSSAPVNPSGEHWWVPYAVGDALAE